MIKSRNPDVEHEAEHHEEEEASPEAVSAEGTDEAGKKKSCEQEERERGPVEGTKAEVKWQSHVRGVLEEDGME